MMAMFDHLQEESDIPFEEEILRNPYSVKFWMRYIEHKANSPKQVINLIYERALKELPGRSVLKIITVSFATDVLETNVE